LAAMDQTIVATALPRIASDLGAFDQLIAFRALQGLGAGGLLPLPQEAIGELFGPRDRARYQGFIGSMWATAAVMGPLLGGVLTDHASWRWIFIVNVPLAVATLVAVARTTPTGVARRRRPIDWAARRCLASPRSACCLRAYGAARAMPGRRRR
jgi:MFS family permease